MMPKGCRRPWCDHAVEESLKRLNVDTIDLCYAHIDDRATPLEETLGAFNTLVQEGKIREIGASNIVADRLRSALEISASHDWLAYVALQLRHSIIAPRVDGDLGAHVATDADVLSVVEQHGLRLVAYSPLLEGGFASVDHPLPEAYNTEDNRERVKQVHAIAVGREISGSQLVLATLIHQNVTPLVGARTPEQLADSLAARDLKLDRGEVRAISSQPDLPAT